jgi:hypothetical protein
MCNKSNMRQPKLASFHLEGMTPIWWQSKMQHGAQQVGKIFPLWHDFISALRK